MTPASLAGERVVVPMPPGWIRLPDPQEAEATAWAERVAAESAGALPASGALRDSWGGLPGPISHGGPQQPAAPDQQQRGPAERLRAELEGALRAAAAQSDPRRLRWVLIGPEPVRSLQAWASLDLVGRVEGATADAFEAAAREPRPEQPGVALWHRQVARCEVAGAAAVVLHDLLTVAAGEDRPPTVQHRALVALFPAEPVVLSFEVSTPRLNAFADIEATAVGIADGIRLAAG